MYSAQRLRSCYFFESLSGFGLGCLNVGTVNAGLSGTETGGLPEIID